MSITRGITIAALGATAVVACGSDGGGGSAESFCGQLEALGESGVDPDTDPDAAVAALNEIADAAPAEVKTEFEEFAAALSALASEDLDAIAELDVDAMTENITKIGAYIGDNCENVDDGFFE